MNDSKRVIGKVENIDSNIVRIFFNNRIKTIDDIRAINLQNNIQISKKRNDLEYSIFLQHVNLNIYNRVIDIGCGIGRFLSFIKDNIKYFIGFDISDEAIKKISSVYTNYKNFNFYTKDIADVEFRNICKKNEFNLFISMGTMMYINDKKIDNIFEGIKYFMDNKSIIYIRESISIMDKRLTLKDFYSDDLKTEYNAIYRTEKEYMELFDKYLIKNGFKLEATDLLLKGELQNRKETNQRYWIFKRS